MSDRGGDRVSGGRREALREALIAAALPYTPDERRAVFSEPDFRAALAAAPSPAQEVWTDVPGHGSTQYLVGADEPPALDVERLAEVLLYFDGDALRSMDKARVYAANIIDAYARLAREGSE